MRKILSSLVFFASFSAAAQSQVTLKEAFQAAVDRTETMRIQQARTRQAEERLDQAQGAILPRLNFNWTYLRSDIPDSATTTTATSSPQQDSINSRFSASQPLFHGFKEFAGVRGFEASLEAQKRTSDFQRITLFSTVATSYFNVLSYDRDLQNLNDLIKVSEDRLRELTSYTKLGRSRRSDLLVSQAQLASLRAQAVLASGTQINAREQFAFVTGLPSNVVLAQPVGDAVPEKLPPLDTMLGATQDRADVKAVTATVEAAEQNVKLQRGGHWPSLDLAGNYYLARTGALQGGKWDVGLNLVFPLYEGGTTMSAVQLAQAQVTEQRLLLEQTKRAVSRDITSAYKLAVTGLDQLKMIRQSLSLTERAFQEVNRDFRRGASTNLDVLQALNSLEDARRTQDRVYFQTILALEQLKIAQGKIAY